MIRAAVDELFEHEVAFLKAMLRVPSDNPPGDCAPRPKRRRRR